MERKGIPILPFIVVGLAIVLLEKYHWYLPDLSFASANPGCGVVEAPPLPACGNAISPEADKLFKQNCASCHFRNRDMTGPALQGSLYDEPFFGWFELFLTNQDSLMKAGDTTCVDLRAKWKINGNHNFDHLTKDELAELRALCY